MKRIQIEMTRPIIDHMVRFIDNEYKLDGIKTNYRTSSDEDLIFDYLLFHSSYMESGSLMSINENTIEFLIDENELIFNEYKTFLDIPNKLQKYIKKY